MTAQQRNNGATSRTMTGVNALEASEGVLAKFWDLASVNQAVRNAAACALVEDLVNSQEKHDGNDESDGLEATVTDIQFGNSGTVDFALRRCSPLLVYGIKRLVKGLGSSREGARQGFALALTLLLCRIESSITPQAVLAVIKSSLQTTTSTKGSENRDLLLGTIFGIGAIIRSSLSIDAAAGCELASSVIVIAEKKWFLREAAVLVLLELFEKMDRQVIEEVVDGVDILKAWITAAPSTPSATPEALLLILRLWARLPSRLLPCCGLLPSGCHPPPDTFFNKLGIDAGAASCAFFNPVYLQTILPLLIGTTWSHPRLHSLWPTILALLIPGFDPNQEQRQSETRANTSPKLAQLEAFWGLVVEDELFTSSHERKYLGFMLFAIVLPHLQSQHVPAVFTPNFLRSLANNLCKQESYLHATARKCMDRIVTFAETSDPSIGVAITLALKRQGGIIYQKFIKAHKARNMLIGLSSRVLQQQAVELQETFYAAAETRGLQEDQKLGGDSAHVPLPSQQQWVVEQLCALCKLPSADAEAKLYILHFLALHAFLRLDPKSTKKLKDKSLQAAAKHSERLRPAIRQLCASRLITLLDSLSKAGSFKGQQKKNEQGTERSCGSHFALQVLQFVEYVAGKRAGVLVSADSSDPAAKSLHALSSLRGAIASQLQNPGGTSMEQGRLRSLQHLSNFMTLQLLGDPDAFDHSLPEDLLHCYRQAFGGDADGSSQSCNDEEMQLSPHWMDSLLDVLLSLLAHSSAHLPLTPLREGVEHVFRTFCDELTQTGMQDILRIVVRPVEAAADGGDDEMFEDVEDVEDMLIEDENASSESHGDDSVLETDSGAEPSTRESSPSEEDETLLEGSAEGDEGNSEDEGYDMDDDAMFRLDAKLAAYFAAARENKKGAKAQVEELLNFKMRAIALIDALVKKAPGHSLLPSSVVPLLSTLVSCVGNSGGAHQALAQRIAGILQNKLARSKPEAAGATSKVSEEQLVPALRRCLYLASRPGDKLVMQSAKAAYQYLLRVAAGSAGGLEQSPAAVGSVTSALADLCTKKRTRLGQQFFHELVRPPLSMGPVLLPPLMGYATSARSDYVRAQAQALLVTILKARSPKVCATAAEHARTAASLVVHVIKHNPAKQKQHLEALRMASMLVNCIIKAEARISCDFGEEIRAAVSAALQAVPPPPQKLAMQLQEIADAVLFKKGHASQEQLDGATIRKSKKMKNN